MKNPSVPEAKELRNHALEASYKTVRTFSVILERPIFLKHSALTPSIQDRTIFTLLTDRDTVYLRTEHGLAFITFRSDPKVLSETADSYAHNVAEVMQKHNHPSDKKVIAKALKDIFSVLENHRVLSLWQDVYPGSYSRIYEMKRHDFDKALVLPRTSPTLFGDASSTLPAKPVWETNILSAFLYRSLGNTLTDSAFQMFFAAMDRALERVERCSLEAVVLSGKMFFTEIIDVLLDEARSKKTEKKKKNQPGKTKTAKPTPGDFKDGKPKDGKPKGALQNRLGMYSKALDKMGKLPKSDQVGMPDDVNGCVERNLHPTVHTSFGVPGLLNNDESPQRPGFKSALARSKAEEALKANTDAQKEEIFERSQAEARDLISKIKVLMRATQSKEKWITGNAKADVKFKAIDTVTKRPLPPEDYQSITRLKALFVRLMGRRRYALDEDGIDIDVGAYLSRLSDPSAPCFRTEVNGAGCEILILVDMSSSMEGEKGEQAERAVRILRRALQLPFVDITVWGFATKKDGKVLLYNFDPKVVDPNIQKYIYGITPLHAALRVANRHLALSSKTKFLFVVTDGLPVFTNSKGMPYGLPQLIGYVGESVKEARKAGVTVAALIIGMEVNGKIEFPIPDVLIRKMFGPAHSWKKVDSEFLGDHLVHLVSRGFAKYLRG